jgi:hypothetical protein
MGVLRVGGAEEGLRIPVALSEPVKIKPLGVLAVEFEMAVLGRDAGSPGAGVWLEGDTHEYLLASNSVTDVVSDSVVSSRPSVRFIGPLSAGQTVSDGDRSLVLAESLAANQVLRVNCATWQVSLDGKPARYMLTPTSSPLEIDPAVESLTSAGPVAAGTISVTVTDLY